MKNCDCDDYKIFILDFMAMKDIAENEGKDQWHFKEWNYCLYCGKKLEDKDKL